MSLPSPVLLQCPSCGELTKPYVRDARGAEIEHQGLTCNRRRECRACGHRWTTVEISAEVFKQLLKGQSEGIGEANMRRRVITEVELAIEKIKERDERIFRPYQKFGETEHGTQTPDQ